MRPTHRKKAGFTLVELLVVIGIIALLISILLPSLQKARQSANSAACLSNLRQIGIAYQLYAQNNRDFLPYAYYWRSSQGFWSWFQVLAPYAGGPTNTPMPGQDAVKANNKLFNGTGCPEYPRDLAHEHNSGYGQAIRYYIQNTPAAAGEMQGWQGLGIRNDWESDVGTPPWKYSKVNRRTTRILNGDAFKSQWLIAGGGWGNWWSWDPAVDAMSGGWGPPTGGRKRHQGKFDNYLFFDGHAASLTPAEALSGISHAMQ